MLNLNVYLIYAGGMKDDERPSSSILGNLWKERKLHWKTTIEKLKLGNAIRADSEYLGEEVISNLYGLKQKENL